MIAIAGWLFAGIALWFTRGVLDVFNDAGRSTRVAMLPSAPELFGFLVLCLGGAAWVAAQTRRWTTSIEDQRDAQLQIALPLFGLALVVVPYLPLLPDIIGPLRSLSGPIVFIIWFVVAAQVVMTFFSVRAGIRPRLGAIANGRGAGLLIGAVTAAACVAAALRLRNTLTGAVMLGGALTPATWGFQTAIAVSAVLIAATAIMSWRWTFAYTGSRSAATLTWIAVMLSTPVFFTGVAQYAELPAAFCMMVAMAWRSSPDRAGPSWVEYLVRGLALSVLPWLSLSFTPMAAAAVVVLGLRVTTSPRAVLAVLVPFTVSVIRLFSLPHAALSLANPLVGMLGLLFDQEFGILPYAPALALGFSGLWGMVTSRDELTRRRGSELALVVLTLLVSAGAIPDWWGATAPPGHPLVPVLPLFSLPIAWAYVGAEPGSVRRASYQLLAVAGLAISIALLVTDGGYLIAQDRDGSSRLLRWLTMLWPLAQTVPASAATGLRGALGLIALWCVAAGTVAWISSRNRLQQFGASALMSLVNISAATIVVALLAPALTRAEPPSATEPEARSRLPMLDDFDSQARPHAIVYRPFTIARATDVPPLLSLVSTPGLRGGGQPIRVLLNGRYALAAGDYTVEIGGVPSSTPVSGTVGLQVGRIGSPLREWPVDLAPGGTWRAPFSLPVDAEFVGFVTSDSLAGATSLRINPVRIVDKNNRESTFHGPSRIVLSSVGFPSGSVFFHDEDVYPERTGFWVHGESTAYMTLAMHHPDAGVTIRVHSGAKPNTVTFATTTWGERVALVPGTSLDVHIPAPARSGPFLFRVTTDHGFVPAEVLPGNTDRRILGCWIEFVEE